MLLVMFRIYLSEINATPNDLEVGIQGYPTVKLYIAVDKANPIYYENERNFNSMREFLNQKLGYSIICIIG